MTAEKPGTGEREPGGAPVPSGEETVVIRSSSRQAEGYSVRPRTQTNAGAQKMPPPETAAPGAETITCEEDVLVLLPSEQMDNTVEMGMSQDLSWQTEAISAEQPGATEEFSAVHDDDVGFLPSEDVSAFGDEVPILNVHPDFATEMTEDMGLADLPELEDVEDITALMDDEGIQLDAPDEVFELDLDELHESVEPSSSNPVLMIATMALAAAAAVAAVFYFRDAPAPVNPGATGGAEVATVTEPVEPGSDGMAAGATSEDGTATDGEAAATGSEAENIDAVAGATDTSTESGMNPSFEGWLESALERHLNVTSDIQG